MASSSPSFLLQLVRYVSSLPTHVMRATTKEGAVGAIRRPLAAPKPQPPGPPAEGPGGHGGIIHGDVSTLTREVMRAAPPRQGTSGKTQPPKRPGAPAAAAAKFMLRLLDRPSSWTMVFKCSRFQDGIVEDG